jgi:nitrite reductase (NO-forming)
MMIQKQTLKFIAAAVTSVVLMIMMIFFTHGCGETYSNVIEGEEYARLTHAPFIPQPVGRDHPAKVIVNLETSEVTKKLADGVEYNFWTFGGDVPGKFIRVREGDLVEFNLSNSPDSKMPHNIDLHAVTGPGGGAEASFTAPGHTSTFSFLVENPGLYVYHCATAPVGLHIANGMYGLILVEPKEGLPPVDKEFYIMQSEFYTEGKFGDAGIQAFSQDKAVNEEPEYVVFNGSVGSLTGDNRLRAKTGEKIRLYIGNGGPNLVSSFHVIGEIFDKVYGEGGVIANQQNVQTTLIPAGGSAIVEFTVDVPGSYTLVDHSIFRAFHKGAIASLSVTGEEDSLVFSHKLKDELYFGVNNKDMGSKYSVNNSQSTDGTSGGNKSLKAMGKNIFTTTCQPCHQVNGEGISGIFPPLAKSDFLNASKERAVNIVKNGLSGPVTVNGKTYNGIMPPQNLNDEQIAAVLTYVYSQWGNSGKTVTKEDAVKVKTKKAVASK